MASGSSKKTSTGTGAGPRLVNWADLEEWQRDNHYIQTSYRAASGSYAACAASLAYLHNESVNIYSHLVGAALFGLGVPAALACAPAVARPDRLALGCFFGGAFACLGMSAAFHAIQNHSRAVAAFGNRLDYLGIVLLIWGSFVPSIYYGFACDPHLVTRYWTMITTVGAGCAVTSTSAAFRTPALRPFRAAMFVAMGLSAVVPVLHGLGLYGYERMSLQMGLPWVVLQGALYIVGAGLYAARVPERFSPGSFDIWGSSHQIFHFFVLLAALVHLTGLLKAYDYNRSLSRVARCGIGWHV